MADAPPIKPWEQIDKDLLQKLINRGKVDITRTGDTDYIDRIRYKSRDLEDHLSGYRREQRGGIILLILLLLFYIASNASLLLPSLNYREQR